MTSADMESVKAGLNSPFWKWLEVHLKKQANEIGLYAVQSPLSDLGSILEREQVLGASRKILEIVREVPQTINAQLQELKEKEDENTRNA